MPKQVRPDDVMRQIGLRLRAVREVEGLTQEVFARAIGVTETALGNWERGERIADVLAMVRLLSRFGVTLEWVYAGHLRGMDFDYSEKLREHAAILGAVVGGTAAEWPMQADVPGHPGLERPPARAPRRPRGTTLHETQGGGLK